MPKPVRSKPVFLSWSGGKDSALALSALAADPEFEVVGVLTSITRGYDRISVHGVRRSLLEEQLDRLGLPLIEISLDPDCTNDAYESAFRRALQKIEDGWPDVAHIAFGDLFLADVRVYRERLLEGTGFTPLFPVWGIDTAELAGRFISEGFSARLVCVDTTQLDAAFAGRLYNRQLLADLPPEVDPCGERGEFHTFVFQAPQFGGEINHSVGERVLREGRFMYCDIQ